MIVCMCNGITSDAIRREIIKQQSLIGDVSLPIIACQLNVGNVCGACITEIELMLNDYKTKKTNDFLKIVKID